MAEVIDFLSTGFSSLYSPAHAKSIILWVLVLIIASVFIYQFYKSTSKRNLISLNLKKYNSVEHPFTRKILAMGLYLLEYIIIIPIIILLWYAGLSIVLMFLAKDGNLEQILLISAAVIGATRVLAYYHSEISKDLAKLFPFITLSVFLLTPGEFTFQIIKEKFYEIPALLSSIFSFILVIVLIEILLRFVYTIYAFYRSENEDDSIG